MHRTNENQRHGNLNGNTNGNNQYTVASNKAIHCHGQMSRVSSPFCLFGLLLLLSLRRHVRVGNCVWELLLVCILPVLGRRVAWIVIHLPKETYTCTPHGMWGAFSKGCVVCPPIRQNRSPSTDHHSAAVKQFHKTTFSASALLFFLFALSRSVCLVASR